MRTSLLTLTAALSTAAAVAQMPDNSICPDFTGTDLNGNSHNLYDYLDQGYTVIVDVSAAWCNPCWGYHNSHALEDLYAAHGPNTTDDKVMVLFIEGESTNTTAQLYGTSSGGQTDYDTYSRGNWVNGTPYPIIDDSDIAQLLQISYFPTVYRICPNRVLTLASNTTASALWSSAQTCPIAETASDGMLLNNLAVDNPHTCLNNEVPLRVRIQNVGTTPLTNAHIEARQGSTVLGGVDWSGSLNTYDVAMVQVAPFTPTAITTNLTYAITSTDDISGNNTAAGKVTTNNIQMPDVHVTLELKTDGYGYETSWKLFNESGAVVQQDPPGYYPNNTAYSYNWTLNADECYRFEIYDLYGDGIASPGYYRLKSNGEQIIANAAFTASVKKAFTASVLSTGVEEINAANGFSVYPNPTNGLVNVEYATSERTTVTVDVFNVLGSTVLTRTFNASGSPARQTIDLGSLNDGVYYMTLTAGDRKVTRKITLSR